MTDAQLPRLRKQWQSLVKELLRNGSADTTELHRCFNSLPSVEPKSKLVECRWGRPLKTALHYACAANNLKLVQWLVQTAQADVNRLTSDKVSALEEARFNNYPNIVAYLKSVGANDSEVDAASPPVVAGAAANGRQPHRRQSSGPQPPPAPQIGAGAVMASPTLTVSPQSYAQAVQASAAPAQAAVHVPVDRGVRRSLQQLVASPSTVAPHPMTERRSVDSSDLVRAVAATVHERDTLRQVISDCERRIAALQAALAAATAEQNAPLNYNLVRSLGKGGFGEVFLGEVPGHAGIRQVAVKEIDLPAEEARGQVERELKMLSQIRHPTIVSVVDGYFAERKREYLRSQTVPCLRIIMEYCSGGSLASLRRPIPTPVLIEITRQVLSGLAFLHSRIPSIQHFDVKPSNICLGQELSENTWDVAVKLVDFGVADEVTSSLSHWGGTAFFWSPERCAPGCHFSLKDDVWAAGVTLLLVGCGLASDATVKDESKRCHHASDLAYKPRLQQLVSDFKRLHSDRRLGRVISNMLAHSERNRCTAAKALAELNGLPEPY